MLLPVLEAVPASLAGLLLVINFAADNKANLAPLVAEPRTELCKFLRSYVAGVVLALKEDDRAFDLVPEGEVGKITAFGGIVEHDVYSASSVVDFFLRDRVMKVWIENDVQEVQG